MKPLKLNIMKFAQSLALTFMFLMGSKAFAENNIKASDYYISCIKSTSGNALQKISCDKNIDYDQTNFNIQTHCQNVTNSKYPNFFNTSENRAPISPLTEHGQFITETSIKGYEIIKTVLDYAIKNCELSRQIKKSSRKHKVKIELLNPDEATF